MFYCHFTDIILTSLKLKAINFGKFEVPIGEANWECYEAPHAVLLSLRWEELPFMAPP